MNAARRSSSAIVFAVALAVRLAIAIWGYARFPPIADGEFYHRFATRLAGGLGYTTAWPDGTVTYAAHYPVGYPAMLSIAYAIFGASAGVAMIVNAFIGAAGAACAHRVALRELSPRIALFAGLAIALHPTLVLYTPAVMTEGVAASLVVIAMACAPHARRSGKSASKHMYYARIVAMGIAFGVATLVRPQTLLFAPIVAYVFVSGTRRARVVTAMVVLGALLVTVSPWTVRNCVRMNRCALVSVNGGWNLLIGARTENGSWTELQSPNACKEVWDEAAKDSCFERAAREEIASSPMAFIERAPKKLAVTFDAFLAGPWYLHASNPKAFGDRAAFLAGSFELVVTRMILIAALFATAPLFRLRLRKKRLARTLPRIGFAIASAAFAVMRTAWPAYLVLAIACFVRDRGERRSPLRAATGVVLLATMATHAMFFGAGRYGILVVPLVTLAAFACVRPKALSASVSSVSGR